MAGHRLGIHNNLPVNSLPRRYSILRATFLLKSGTGPNEHENQALILIAGPQVGSPNNVPVSSL